MGAGSTRDTDADSEKLQARRMKTRNRVMRGDGGSEQSHARRHRVKQRLSQATAGAPGDVETNLSPGSLTAVRRLTWLLRGADEIHHKNAVCG